MSFAHFTAILRATNSGPRNSHISQSDSINEALNGLYQWMPGLLTSNSEIHGA